MRIKLYPPTPVQFEVVPGERFREWMSPHSYKCLPLAAANMLGWDILSPCRISAMWNGGKGQDDVVVIDGNQYAAPHFGLGTFTLNAGFVWETDPGVQLMVMPAVNAEWTGAVCLNAVIETDKLRYPWFITMRIVEPHKSVVIPEGVPLCRVVPVRIQDIVTTQISYEQMPDKLREEMGVIEGKRPEMEWTQVYQRQAEFTSIKTPEVDDAYHR